jgi:hypothetical protein
LLLARLALPPQVLEVFEYEFKVAAASLPNTCAHRPEIGGPEPTPAELTALFDLFQVRLGLSRRQAFAGGRPLPAAGLCRRQAFAGGGLGRGGAGRGGLGLRQG